MCDASPPSLAPFLPYNGPAQPPLNNSRPGARGGSRSRPSRPVYERKKIQKSIENFIPRELDDFGPDSLDLRPNENGLHREKGNYGCDEVNSAPMNNEIPRRMSRDCGFESEALVRNTDNTVARKQLQRKTTGGNAVVGETSEGNSDLSYRPPRKETSLVNTVARKQRRRKTNGDSAVVGETSMGNSNLPYRPPRKEAVCAKSVAVDPLAKGSSEIRNGFTGDTRQAPVVKPTESSMGERKMNTGGTRKPANERAPLAPVRQTRDSTNSTVDSLGKQSSELRNGFTSDTHQAPVVKPTESSMGQRKMNTGAARKPTPVLQKRDSTNSTVSIWTKGSMTLQSGYFLGSARPLFRICSSCVWAKGD